LNSSHVSFLAPCSAEQLKAVPLACSDPPRFDHVAFHKKFSAAVLAFLDKHLRAGDLR
jgi:hypothetical protein